MVSGASGCTSCWRCRPARPPRYELHLFVYKPAGAFVSVPLKTARQVQPFQTEAVVEGEQMLTTTAPLALAPGGHALWLDVRVRRETGIG